MRTVHVLRCAAQLASSPSTTTDRSRPSGLRVTQFTLLTMLALGGPLPLSRVADRLGMERTTLSRNLRPLIAKGLVTVRHGDDHRVRTIALTAKGRHAAVAALPQWRKAQRALAGRLTPGVLASLDAAARVLPTSHTPANRTRATHEKEIEQ